MNRRCTPYTLVALMLSLWAVSTCTKARPPAFYELDVVELTAEQIQMDYALGRYTAVQLTQAFLERIACYEDHYNAFISMNPEALPSTPALPFSAWGRRPEGPFRTLLLPKRWWGLSRLSDLYHWRGSCP